MGHQYIGCEHLLLGLADGGGPAADAVAADALAAFGARRERLRALVAAEVGLGDDPLDADALASLGIDLDAVRRATEASFGRGALERGRLPGCGPRRSGHIPFTPRAKKSLELALRAAVNLRHNTLTSGHLLLGIIDQGSNAALLILRQSGVPVDALRQDVTDRLTAAA